MELKDFHHLHEGETCLIIGNGPSLNDIPDWFLNSYLNFGCNLIHEREGFTPTYYVAVDGWVHREMGDTINEIYADVPKFLPTPNRDAWVGPNIYRFHHRAGPLWPYSKVPLWPSDILSARGITFKNVTHVSVQLAYFMGFKTMLLVGMDNTMPEEGGNIKHVPWPHFYHLEPDPKMPGQPLECEEAFRILMEGMKPDVQMINISTETSMTKIPRQDWRQWINGQAQPPA